MAKSAINFYNFAKYHLAAIENGYKSLMKSMVVPKNTPISVMDIGCGPGRALNEVLVPLLPGNVTEIIGTDIDENMLELCRSMNTNQKITFEKLDITDDSMPKHLQNRFELLFSSYCFSYIDNWRQALLNCSRLLKPNGELFVVSQFKTNALYTTYRKMATMDRWKPYTKEYSNFIPPFSCEDPDSELKKIFQDKDVGMVLKNHKFDHDHFMELPKKENLDVYLGLDTKLSIIPEDLKKAYMEDFIQILGEETETDYSDENTLKDIMKIKFPTVIIHARNCRI